MLVDGHGRPLVIAVTPGQAGDSPAFPKLLAELRVPRLGPGRPRTRPDAVRGDKAYSSRGHRQHRRSRGITAVIPEPADQIDHCKNKGSRGGRPASYDIADYKNRNAIERAFNVVKNWRGLASRYGNYAVVYRGGLVLAASLTWLRSRSIRDTP